MTKKPKPPKKSILSEYKARPPEIPQDELSFSFKYLDLDTHQDFSLSKCGENYFDCFLQRLKNLSGMKTTEFINANNTSIRSHIIKWEKTEKPTGFTRLPSHLQEIAPRQFSIDANRNGRIHGFLIGDVFFVIWLDPQHLLYP